MPPRVTLGNSPVKMTKPKVKTDAIPAPTIIAGQPDPTSFAQLLLETVKVMKEAESKKATKEKSEGDGESVQPTTVTAGGLGLSKSVRTKAMIEQGKMQVSRYDRGDGASKEKLRVRLCVKLPHEFAITDYTKLMSPDANSDMASVTLNIQVMIKSFTDFCIKSDSKPIYLIPVGVDLSDIDEVISAVNHKDLLKHYRDVSLETVKQWQVFINTSADAVDMESSNWALDVLKKSTEKGLLLKVNQTFDNYDVTEQGGVTFFKLLVDEVDKGTFEMRQALLKWVENFDVRYFEGEHVSQASTHFKAVIVALGSSAPEDFTRIYLRGCSNASCKEFSDHCNAQLGIFQSMIHRKYISMYDMTPLSVLDDFSANLNERYNALAQTLK